VTLRLNELASIAHIATGQMGKIGEDYVEGRLDFDGSMRDLMALAAVMMAGDPTQVAVAAPVGWMQQLLQLARSHVRHRPRSTPSRSSSTTDVSDDFYALWLDPKRVYSCAYYRDPGMSLAQARTPSSSTSAES